MPIPKTQLARLEKEKSPKAEFKTTALPQGNHISHLPHQPEPTTNSLLHPFLLILILILTTLTMIFQDWKSRKIHLWLYVPLFVSCTVLGLVQFGFNAMWAKTIGLNLCFLTLQLLVISLYFGIKNKRFSPNLKGIFGIGDTLFLVGVAFVFDLTNYILFTIISSVLAMLVSLLIANKNRGFLNKIPFVSFMGIVLLAMLCAREFGISLGF